MRDSSKCFARYDCISSTQPHPLTPSFAQSLVLCPRHHTSLSLLSPGAIQKSLSQQALLWLPLKLVFTRVQEKATATHSSTLAWRIPWTEEPGGLQSMGSQSRTRLSDFTFSFLLHALEKEMATHSSVLAWRLPGTGEPGGLPSMGSHRVGHN